MQNMSMWKAASWGKQDVQSETITICTLLIAGVKTLHNIMTKSVVKETVPCDQEKRTGIKLNTQHMVY